MKLVAIRCAQLALAPFALLLVLCILGSGFGLAFVRTFDIENRTSETLHVSAVGSLQGGGKNSIPLLLSWLPLMPAATVSPRELPAGARRRFGYDMDNIQFTELLVVRPGGDARMLVTQSPLSLQGGYYGLKEDVLVLEHLDTLRRATPEVLACESNGRRVWILRIIFLLGLLALPLEFALQRAARRARSAPRD